MGIQLIGTSGSLSSWGSTLTKPQVDAKLTAICHGLTAVFDHQLHPSVFNASSREHNIALIPGSVWITPGNGCDPDFGARASYFYLIQCQP